MAYMSKDDLILLAAEAKTDKQAALRLWFEVERFARKVTGQTARKYIRINGFLTEDDYFQCAYIGFTNAVRLFKPELGYSFLSCLEYGIRSACWREYQKLCRKTINIISLDAPLQGTGEEDMGTLMNFLPDEAVERAFDTLLTEDIAKLILATAQRFGNVLQTRIIFECVYGGRTLASLADELGISRQSISNHHEEAIMRLRRNPEIKAIQREFFANTRATKDESRLDPYRIKSVIAFKSDFTSIVEEIATRLVSQSGQTDLCS